MYFTTTFQQILDYTWKNKSDTVDLYCSITMMTITIHQIKENLLVHKAKYETSYPTSFRLTPKCNTFEYETITLKVIL
jgi:hypothetical protein